MAFTLVTGQTGTDGDSVFTFPANCGSGNLLVAGLNWESSAEPPPVFQFGSSNYTAGTEATAASDDMHGQLHYHLTSIVEDRVDITWPGASWISNHAEFDNDDSPGPSFDTQNTGTGSSGTSFSTGNITLDSNAGAWLVVAHIASYSPGHTFSNRQINGVAADGFVDGLATRGTTFWRFLTSPFSGGNATCTGTVSDHWVATIMAFKAGAAGGGGVNNSLAWCVA